MYANIVLGDSHPTNDSRNEISTGLSTVFNKEQYLNKSYKSPHKLLIKHDYRPYQLEKMMNK